MSQSALLVAVAVLISDAYAAPGAGGVRVTSPQGERLLSFARVVTTTDGSHLLLLTLAEHQCAEPADVGGAGGLVVQFKEAGLTALWRVLLDQPGGTLRLQGGTVTVAIAGERAAGRLTTPTVEGVRAEGSFNARVCTAPVAPVGALEPPQQCVDEVTRALGVALEPAELSPLCADAAQRARVPRVTACAGGLRDTWPDLDAALTVEACLAEPTLDDPRRLEDAIGCARDYAKLLDLAFLGVEPGPLLLVTRCAKEDVLAADRVAIGVCLEANVPAVLRAVYPRENPAQFSSEVQRGLRELVTDACIDRASRPAVAASVKCMLASYKAAPASRYRVLAACLRPEVREHQEPYRACLAKVKARLDAATKRAEPGPAPDVSACETNEDRATALPVLLGCIDYFGRFVASHQRWRAGGRPGVLLSACSGAFDYERAGRCLADAPPPQDQLDPWPAVLARCRVTLPPPDGP